MNTEKSDQSKNWRRVIIHGAILLILALATVVACLNSSASVASPETGVSMDLPPQLGNFSGIPQEVSEAEKFILPPDTEFSKMLYTDLDGDQINTQIVLAGAAKQSIHRPEVCLPGQGWTIKSSQTLKIPLPSGSVLPVTMLRIARPVDVGGSARELNSLFIYWFVGKDTVTASHLVRVLKTNLDVILHNTNHRWAYVIASAPVLAGFTAEGKTEPETLKMLTEFIQKIAPDVIKAESGDPPSA